ncbi:hypothetical protein T05_14818 [Trichinella murrelli]|uniref:Uncharacterized protein n=1 Tax=Trichinella murrelli TaxID=144512 RepID=A0A0V0TQ28_9BILA|nr:hypothetical protein T05_14818 [Trichinella murrelli]
MPLAPATTFASPTIGGAITTSDQFYFDHWSTREWNFFKGNVKFVNGERLREYVKSVLNKNLKGQIVHRDHDHIAREIKNESIKKNFFLHARDGSTKDFTLLCGFRVLLRLQWLKSYSRSRIVDDSSLDEERFFVGKV